MERKLCQEKSALPFGAPTNVKLKLPITVKPEQNCKNLKFFQITSGCGNCSVLKSEPGQWLLP